MHFIIQRRSDGKYLDAAMHWIPSPDRADRYLTEASAHIVCTLQTGDDFDIFLRFPDRTLVRFNHEPIHGAYARATT